METFGQAVRRLRGPMSQRQLARRAHIDPGHLSRLESGRRRPTEKLAATIDAALDAGGVLLALAASPPATSRTTHPSGLSHNGGQPMAGPTVWGSAEDDEMNRRDLLRLLSVAGASVTALPGEPAPVDWARLADAADRDVPLDQAMIDQYAQVNAHLWSAYAGARSKATVLAAAHGHVNILIEALRRPGMPTQRQRMCGLLGETLQLTGEIHFDRNRYTEAAHCYTLAATASREAEAYDLWACALTRQAIIANFERQHGAAASALLEAAAGLARRGDSNLSTRFWVSVVHAQALAGLGDTDGCHRALDHAEAVRDLTGPVHTGGWLRFDGSRLAEERGACQVHLGQPDPAEITLTHALGADLSARRRGGVLADLAMVGVLRRDPLRIVSYAEAALDIARHTRSGYLQTKLHTVAAHLAPFSRDRHIRHLHAQITDLTPATIQA